MSLQFAVFNKCRACLSPETIVEFVRLAGSTAEMFKVVTDIELPIEIDKSDSMICPDCFNAIEQLHNFKVMAKQAEIFFKLKQRLAPVLEKCNEEAKRAPKVRTEPRNNPSTARIEFDFVVEGFENKGGRRTPMRKHPREKLFCCSKCGSEFSTEQNLLQHLKTKRIKKCAVCDEKFSCKLLLDRHYSESHGGALKCNKCPYETRRKGYFVQHKLTHDKPMTCETCPKKFASSHHLKLHQMQHRHGPYTTAPVGTFDCDKCDKSYSSVRNLKQHQRQAHDEIEVKCEVCDKICKNKHVLFNHSRIHAKVECTSCHKAILRHSLENHMRIIHSVESIFRCDLCDYSSNTKYNLKYHIDRMHLLRKLVIDSKIRTDFSDFELLEKLQLRHGSVATASEKKLKCDRCDKTFVGRYTLTQHKGRVHTAKKFKCKICINDKAFKSTAQLRDHTERVHAEVSCTICNKKFSKRRLRFHMKIHTHGN